jgi:receptor tyrosine kinase
MKTLFFFFIFNGLINICKSDEGYCAPYAGKICKSYIKNIQVWFPASNGWENEKITTALFAELIEDLDSLCHKPAAKLLCAYAFPKCKLIDGKATSLPLCYEDCVAVEKVFCYDSWVLLQEKKQRGEIYPKSKGHFKLPECDELPRYNKSSKVPTCSYIGLTEMNLAEVTSMKNKFN